MDPDKIELNIQLTVTEINYILSILGKHPFDEVYTIITKLKVQGDSQLKSLDEASTPS